MLFTLSGIVILVRLLQLSNAESPIAVTLLGITMFVKLWAYLNAPVPIAVTLLGITYEFPFFPSGY